MKGGPYFETHLGCFVIVLYNTNPPDQLNVLTFLFKKKKNYAQF